MNKVQFAARLLAGASMVSFALPGIGYAQTSAPLPATVDQAATSTAVPVAPDGMNAGDIVVTAQRRSEKLSDVPISITAATGQQLTNSGVTNTQDLTNIVPGLKVDRVGGSTAPAIRGISTQIAQPGADANVAIYVDGVYQPNQFANTFDLPDIQRVEVLKGPQGTLFGRNATGGAIRIVTLDPSFTATGRLTAGYGSFNDRTVNGYVAGPIVDGLLAGSISGYYDKNDGYLRNVVNDERIGGVESENLRGKLMLTPSSSTKFVLSGFYSKRNDASNSYAAAIDGNSELANVPGAILANGAYNVAVNPAIDASINFHSYGGSLRGTIDTDPGTVSFIAAGSYTKIDVDLPASFGYSPGGGTEYLETIPDHNYSAELNFASRKFGRFSFVAGLYAYYDKSGQEPVVVATNYRQPVPDFLISIFSRQTDHAYAAFAEGTYELTDQLTIIAGLRYSYERRAIYGGVSVVGQALLNQDPGPLQKFQSKAWRSVTPRVSLKYALDSSSNVYATFSQGFKSGVYNASAVTDPPVNPEHVDAYEVGYKGAFGRRFSTNIALFYYRYKDIQVNAFKTITDPVTGELVNLQQNLNAASGDIYGGEWNGTAQIFRDLSVTAGLAYLHAKYDKFPNGPSLYPLPDGGNLSTLPLDESGNWLVRSPKLTVNASVDYSHQTDIGKIGVSANLFHTSRFYYDSQNRVSQSPYTLVNLRGSLQIAGTGLTIGVFVKNLTDKTYAQGTYLLASGDGIMYAPPRTYGGTIQFSF
jgi:iron complex outermembrane receptor protein